MFYSAAVAALMVGSASAFLAPAQFNSVAKSSGALSMKLGSSAEGLIGSDLELPEFDPLGFTNNPAPGALEWYRAAELKHGRVAMLAALGQLVQSFYHLPDPVFSESAKPWQALVKVCNERPLAAVQIGLAIFACEAIGQANQAKPGQAAGDLGWDPLNLRGSNEEIFERAQLRELKNGRLAMIAITAMIVQENLTGYGVIEAYRENAINPFGDGKGFF
uniref:Fucoxanthin-chlorophyll a-c binding protein, chloroplastic n=1 Tax=Chattonella marina var. antiqua TaxID=859642 RepID=FCP_CHAMQ|nr:RecName: Full=Fucoxanthin-chlorophyll a-c binding protein, chloroplastic; Short=FCP; Flags: Precursor [Chattonella marina var. antiqua]BBL54383.1 light harvesting protein [Chattonella marina var. antiqua]